jgi:hypothetical protein
VDLDDHGDAAAGGEHRGGLVRALDEHRVRPEVLELAPHEPGQGRPEPHSLQRGPRGHEAEGLVTRRRALPGGGEHAHVQLGAERVELPAQPALEGQPVPRPAHDQHAGPHAATPLGRGSRRSRQPLAQVGVVEEAADRPGQGLRVARRDQQAVLPVGDDLAHAADVGRDRGRPHGERLDEGVREVLPGRGEKRRVGATEERQHLVTGQRAQEANAAVQTQLVRPGLESGALVAVACQLQLDLGHPGDRVERDPERLGGGQAAGEREQRPLPASTLGKRRQGRRRVRQDRDSFLGHAPAEHEAGEEGAGADDVRGPAELSVAGRAQDPRLPGGLEGYRIAGEPPPPQGPLEGGVLRELGHERGAGEQAAERRAAEHAG